MFSRVRSGYRQGLEVVTGLIELLQLATTSNNNSSWIYAVCN
jgi:hypothetical protein